MTDILKPKAAVKGSKMPFTRKRTAADLEYIAGGAEKLKALVASPLPDDLPAIAERIRTTMQKNMVAVGLDLLKAKRLLVDHGEFGEWLKREFNWTARTAQRFMLAAETFGEVKSDTVSYLPPTMVYQITAPSTAPEIRAEVVGDLKAGKLLDKASIAEKLKDDRQRRADERERQKQADHERMHKRTVPSAAIRKRQAEARAAEEERQRLFVEAQRNQARRAVAILRKLGIDDAIELLTILAGNGYGANDRIHYAKGMLTGETEMAS